MIVTPIAVNTLGLWWWIIWIMQALTCDSKEKNVYPQESELGVYLFKKMMHGRDIYL